MMNPGSEESVTLTKSQLWAILEAIGQPAHSSSPNGSNQNSASIDKFHASENQSKSKKLSSKQGESDHYQPWSSDPHSNLNGRMPTKLGTPLIDGRETDRMHKRTSSPTESVSSKSTMSKLEQKRLQWERERAEMQDWNPWGRPGAGAPMRKAQQVAAVAPITTESQLLMVHANSLQPSADNSRISTCLPSHTYPLRTVPPAMRSSIPFGPNSFTTEEETERMRREWLNEIEQDHKAREISGWLGESALSENTWPMDQMTKSSTDPGRSYMRGHGHIVDSATAAEMNERHQKALEYQQAIRAQMEEKARRRKEEQLQRLREEQQEEKRLEEERARLQLQYEQEQQKLKEKEEQERKKREALIAAMEEAHAAAEAAKKARKSKRANASQNSSATTVKAPQTPINPSPSMPPSSTVSHSPFLQPEAAVQDETNKVITRPAVQNNTVAVHPVQPAETNTVMTIMIPDHQQDSALPKIMHEIGVQARLPTPAFLPYIQNRILTPSRLRMELRNSTRSLGREFGTQTELSFPSSLLKELSSQNSSPSPSSSAQSSPTHVPASTSKGKPLKATWRNSSSRPTEDRPKWGVNKPQKPFVKNTERDPRSEQHKMFQTLRKQHWEKEMAMRKTKVGNRRHMTKSEKEASQQIVTSSESEPRSLSPTPQSTDQEFNNHQGKHQSKPEAKDDATSYTTYTVNRRPRSYSLENIPSSAGSTKGTVQCSRCQNSLPLINDKLGSLPVERRKWHSQDVYVPAGMAPERMPEMPNAMTSIQAAGNEGALASNVRRKWSDQESFDLENVAMSKAVAHSRSSLANNTEATDAVPSSVGADGVRRYGRLSPKNPLFYPEVVTGQPTPRQDQILQQLALLRRGLLHKQRELDNVIYSREKIA